MGHAPSPPSPSHLTLPSLSPGWAPWSWWARAESTFYPTEFFLIHQVVASGAT